MSSKVTDLYRDGWHIYWDVNEPILTISSPGHFETDDMDNSYYKENEIVLTKDEAEHLMKSIQDMLKYWNINS